MRMHGPLWDKVSSEAKELIQNLMAFDAGARLTVDKVCCQGTYLPHLEIYVYELDGSSSKACIAAVCIVLPGGILQ